MNGAGGRDRDTSGATVDDRPPAEVLADALATLSSRSAARPETDAYREAATAVAGVADQRPAVVAGSVGSLWAAAERTVDATERLKTAEQTVERYHENLAVTREGLLEALVATASVPRSHPELVAAAGDWLTDGGLQRLHLGLRLAETVIAAGPTPWAMLRLARGLHPAAAGDHEGISALDVDDDSVVHDDVIEAAADHPVVGHLLAVRADLAGAIVDGLETAETPTAVSRCLVAQDILVAGGVRAVVESARRSLEVVGDRDLVAVAPERAAAVPTGVLHTVQVAGELPSVDRPDAETVRLSTAVLAEVASLRPELTSAFDLLGTSAQEAPELFTDSVDALVRAAGAVEDNDARRTLLEGLATVIPRAPDATARQVDRLVGLLEATDRPLGDGSLLKGLSRVAREDAAALVPHVEDVAEVVGDHLHGGVSVDDERPSNLDFDDEWLSGLPLGDEGVARHACELFAHVTTAEPSAVAPHVGTVAAMLDPVEETDETTIGLGVQCLSRVAAKHPEVVVPHMDTLADGVAAVTDVDYTDRAVAGLLAAGAVAPDRLRSEVPALARGLREQSGLDRMVTLRALIEAQQRTPELKPVVVATLRTALPTDRSEDEELYGLVGRALRQVADGTEAPPTGAAIVDTLGRTGYAVLGGGD
jgi:hypothetical protein